MEIIAGVDEAGRGCLAGPVVAGAVILPESYTIPGLKDSKKMTPRQRDLAYDAIVEQAVDWSVGFVDNRIIDRINILQATFKAMQIALGNLRIKPDLALIDGHELPNQIIPNRGIVDGDNQIPCIQAASVMAKVSRDRWMEKLDVILPEYGLKRHKGYGTQQHMEALSRYKASPLHRKSFRPVKENMPTLSWLIMEKRIGWMGERLAALFLLRNGYEILEMNHQSAPFGELDIICRKDQTLVFVEVKSARKMSRDLLLSKIDERKLERLYQSVDSYLSENSWKGDIRLDAIFVYLKKGGPEIIHYEAIGGAE
ncbi:MAG: ribonuclease HII [Fidelibacterota bacterium]